MKNKVYKLKTSFEAEEDCANLKDKNPWNIYYYNDLFLPRRKIIHGVIVRENQSARGPTLREHLISEIQNR